ncbi:MAG: GNAT family N-acetyltransferase [Pseudomonadota bacterium]
MSDDPIIIRTDLRPGDLGRLIALHGDAYGPDEAHFGLTFEAFVARTVADYILDDGGNGRIWFAEQGDRLAATAALVVRPGTAVGDAPKGQLRWIVADPAWRGRGLGKRLIEAAIGYARERGCDEAYLETTDGLDASMAIYRKLGFVETERVIETMWRDAPKITMRLSLTQT